MANNWDDQGNLLENNKNMKEILTWWSQDNCGDIGRRKARVLARIAVVQRKIAVHRNNGLLRLEKKLRKELEQILAEEELIWFQKSREEWI